MRKLILTLLTLTFLTNGCASGNEVLSRLTAEVAFLKNQVTAGGDVHGPKGIEYTSTLPAGMGLLVAFTLWLGHRREMKRLSR